MSEAGLLSDQIYRQLLIAIRTGDYAGQSRLPSEADMALRFKVSRPVLRQALAKLRDDGVVGSKRGSGTFVTSQPETAVAFSPLQSIPDVQQCLEFRCAVEGEAAAAAAAKRTAAQLEQIDRALAACEGSIIGSSDAVDADFEFHMMIALATNNSYFGQTMQALRSHIGFSINLIQTLSTRPSTARLAEVRVEHRAIADAIRAMDEASARLRMAEHIRSGLFRLFPPQTEPAIVD